MRKLIWLLPAVALGIAPPAAEADLDRPHGSRPVRHFPGSPNVGHPLRRPSGVPGLPGQFVPFGPGGSPWLEFDPANLPGWPYLPGRPGQRFGPPFGVPGLPGQPNRFDVPRFSYAGIPGQARLTCRSALTP